MKIKFKLGFVTASPPVSTCRSNIRKAFRPVANFAMSIAFRLNLDLLLSTISLQLCLVSVLKI